MEGTLRDRWLMTLSVSRVMLYALYMAYAACLPVLIPAWNMTATQAGTVSGAYMVTYGISLVAASALADRFGARRVFMGSAWSTGIASMAFGLFADSYASALALYCAVALCQGGVYSPAVMLFADRYPVAVRGRAVGMLIASTSLGYALSLLTAGLMLGLGGYRLAFVVCGALPLLGAAISAYALRATPNVVHARPRGEPALRAIRRNPDAVRLIAGYTGHSWELIGSWQWLPAFLAVSIALSGGDPTLAAALGAGATAVMHGCGSIAASTMGSLSVRLGRRRVLLGLALAGAVFSLGIGWLVTAPFIVLVVLALLYGFVTVGDSPVLSTALTEAVAPRHLGAALATRSVFGFGAGAIAPVAFGAVLDATSSWGSGPLSWGLAFGALGLGGLVATVCARRLTLAPEPTT